MLRAQFIGALNRTLLSKKKREKKKYKIYNNNNNDKLDIRRHGEKDLSNLDLRKIPSRLFNSL